MQLSRDGVSTRIPEVYDYIGKFGLGYNEIVNSVNRNQFELIAVEKSDIFVADVAIRPS